MRLARLTSLLAMCLCGLSRTAEIEPCCEGLVSDQLTASDVDPDNALRIAKKLPFDYSACAERVLSHALAEDPPAMSAFVGVFGADPDTAILDRLRKVHPNTFPLSATPPQKVNTASSSHWQYNLYLMREHRGYGYEAIVGYYCGGLCAGSTKYILQPEGSSCKVISSQPFGPTA